MTLFVSAVDEGSLAAAARRHGRSPAAVTRAIALLERHAGEMLMLRSTRTLGLTAAGDQHLETFREVLAKLQQLEPENGSPAMRGKLVLTAPELFGRLKLMPVVESFLDAHEQVAARIILTNRLVDLVGEGVDLAVRLASLPDSTLTAIKVGEVGSILCASPEYLARAGTPASPLDLHGHRCIGLNAGADGEPWTFAANDGGGRVRSVRVRTRLSVNNAAAAIDAGLRGQGILCARSYQVAGAIAEGRLTRILAAFEPPPTPVQLLYHPERARHGTLRAFIDHAAPLLKREVAAVSSDLRRLT